ncbi:hypothetical protein [Urbifossiella limnaea]|uniref:SMI1/KNR4 family protein n=1 Tax=Urbifossiella limnaea TaxID=2528023 RepID=A0A517XXG4_9BACT|nr:hypothetical protein [Urbifossiella limnaea]QDU22206.1 hypothetical protein ETAA1_41830 [Urbifossiella limnaea]
MQDRASERKARLLGAARVRWALRGVSAPGRYAIIDLVERFADGGATAEELEAVWSVREDYVRFLTYPAPAARYILGFVGNAYPLREEREATRDLVRDIFGNPFRPVPFDPSWRTEAVVGLARGMYESRDFGPIPVLADALEDAGCADADVLGHCRGPGPHVRGCWVVDLVLGKE